MKQFSQRTRDWNGVTAVLSEISTERGLFLATGSTTHAKIAIALAQYGGRCNTRLRWDRAEQDQSAGFIMHYLPANVPTWCVSKEIRRLRHLALMIDLRALPVSLCERPERWPDEPRLGLSSAAMHSLAQLIASETDLLCTSDPLYGDSLVLAMLSQLLRLTDRKLAPRHRHGLTQQELSRVTELMHTRVAEGVDLQTLCELTGLAQSSFCQAFKLATGTPPYRYFQAIRIERAKELLRSERGVTIASIAGMLGFADQSHFTRVFRDSVGMSPSAWRAEHMRQRAR